MGGVYGMDPHLPPPLIPSPKSFPAHPKKPPTQMKGGWGEGGSKGRKGGFGVGLKGLGGIKGDLGGN